MPTPSPRDNHEWQSLVFIFRARVESEPVDTRPWCACMTGRPAPSNGRRRSISIDPSTLTTQWPYRRFCDHGRL